MAKYTFKVTKLNHDRRRTWDNLELTVKVIKAKTMLEAERKARDLAGYKGFQTDVEWKFDLKEVEG